MNAPPVTLVKGFADELSIDAVKSDLALIQRPIRMFGREIMQPRLTALMGSGSYQYSGKRMEPQEWSGHPSYLRGKVYGFSTVRPDVCLANYYRDGNDSIAWHSDDEPEIDQTKPIFSLSFGAPRVFQVRPSEGGTITSYTLGHGDLLIMAPGMQSSWKHAISKVKNAGPRLNLTFRNLV